jgi:hypothetical protein
MRDRRVSRFRAVTDDAESKQKQGHHQAAAQLYKQAITIEFIP